MKTVQFNAFGSTDVLEYTDLSVPSPLADQVLIEVTTEHIYLFFSCT